TGRRFTSFVCRPARHSKRKLPLGEIFIIVKFHSEITFERLDDVGLQLLVKLVPKRFHRRIVPEFYQRKPIPIRPRLLVISDRKNCENVRRQKFIRLRNGAARSQAQEGGHNREETFHDHKCTEWTSERLSVRPPRPSRPCEA